jgi:hypothetical protein
MPTVKDLSTIIDDVAAQIAAIKGVKGVYVWGSFATNRKNPDFVVKDIDIIASTDFDSGDLLAIDNTRYSALRIRPTELEDEGFNPLAVSFTKAFLSMEKFNVDHWATTADGKLLHWGATPDSHEEWHELHLEAEKVATKATALRRGDLRTSDDGKRKEWKLAYDRHISKSLCDSSSGWCPTIHNASDILSDAIQLA